MIDVYGVIKYKRSPGALWIKLVLSFANPCAYLLTASSNVKYELSFQKLFCFSRETKSHSHCYKNKTQERYVNSRRTNIKR